MLVARGVPSGTDETIHLLRAFTWAGRLPAPMPMDAHRVRGVSALVYPMAEVTDRVSIYRVAFAVLGLLLPVATYLAGRRFLGRAVAAWSAALVGLSWVVVYQSIQVLPDVLGGALVALAFAAYWSAVVSKTRHEQLGPIWPAGLALGVAFYFNMAYAGIGGVAIAIDFLLHERRRLLSKPVLLGSAAVAGVLSPYLLRSAMDHGNPFAPIAQGLGGITGGLGAPLPGGDPGYVVYARWFFDPGRLFTPETGLAIIAGTALALIAAFRGWPIPKRHASALAVWLVFLPLAMALLFHAEERYLLPAWPAFFLAIGVLARGLLSPPNPRWRRIIAAGMIAYLPVFGAAQFAVASRKTSGQIARFGFVHQVAGALATRTRHPCLVFTRYPRQFALRTGCRTRPYHVHTRESLLREAARFDGSVYLAWIEGANRQPPWFAHLAAGHAVQIADIPGDGPLGAALLYRFTG